MGRQLNYYRKALKVNSALNANANSIVATLKAHLDNLPSTLLWGNGGDIAGTRDSREKEKRKTKALNDMGSQRPSAASDFLTVITAPFCMKAQLCSCN